MISSHSQCDGHFGAVKRRVKGDARNGPSTSIEQINILIGCSDFVLQGSMVDQGKFNRITRDPGASWLVKWWAVDGHLREVGGKGNSPVDFAVEVGWSWGRFSSWVRAAYKKSSRRKARTDLRAW